MKQVFMTIATMTDARYYHPQTGLMSDGGYTGTAVGATSERDAIMYLGDNGTVKNLRVDVTAAPGAGTSWTITLRVNGVDTAAVVTLSNSETSETSAEVVNISTGDYISYSVAASGSPTAAVGSITLEYSLNTAKYSMISGGIRDTSSNIYCPAMTYQATNLSSDNAYYKMPAPISFTIRAIYVSVTTAPGAGATRGIYLRNAGATIATVGVAGTDLVTASTGLSLAVTQGDLLSVRDYRVSGPAGSRVRYSFLIESADDGYSICPVGYGNFSTGVADARFGMMFGSGSNVTTERKNYCAPTGFTLLNLYQYNDTIGASDSRIVTLYKNGVASALTCTCTSGTTASDLVNQVVFAEGDYGGVFADTNATAKGWGNFIMAMYIPPSTPKGLPLMYAG